ncbi:MAG: DNA internalization-related competence protein ComEC/Rec2 [Candidatus Acidiferrum sp.]
MKLPALAIAAAFAGGILLGLLRLPVRVAGHPIAACLALVIFSLLITSTLLALREFLWPAAIVSLAAWMGLGILAGVLANQPLPAEHVLSRFAAHQIPQKTPLRWHGTLRGEPSRLPWGYSLDLSISGVETADGYSPVSGGMRLGFTPRENDPALPEVHAGDEICALTEARLPLVYKDAGAFDRREFLARQDIHVLATLRASVLLEKTGASPWRVQFWIARVHGGLRDRLDRMFPQSPATAGILRAMLLGDRSFVERAESVDFQKTGVFHVLVVAGLHVGALGFFLFWVARKLRMTQAARTLFVLGGLFAHVTVVEQRAPVLRAALMAGLVILGSYFYRRLELVNSAALAATVLLVANPKFVTDTGFQLSFLAIGAIAGLALPLIRRSVEPFARALKNWRDVTRDASYPAASVQFRMDFRDAMYGTTGWMKERYAHWAQEFGGKTAQFSCRVAELFVLSFVLQLGMLPLMAREFHRISLLGPVANLLVVPLTGAIVPFGFLCLGCASVWPRLAGLMAHPLVWMVLLQQRMVAWLAAVPRASYRIPGPPVWVMLCFFLVALVAVIRLRSERVWRRWEAWPVSILLIFAAAVMAVYPFRPRVTANQLEVTVLDVAQGDSILVVSPNGSTLLIDGGGAFQGFQGREEHLGPDPGEEAVSAYLWSRGFQKLDAVALTHAHQDHIGGLTAVLQNFHVSRLLVGRDTAAPAFGKLLKLAASLHVSVEHERRAQNFLWDGVQVDILWPENAPEDVAPLAKNNDSLVIRLKFRDRTILLPGDAEKEVEYQMLGENDRAFLHADVLKVGHHGSKNSTMPEFLSAVGPQISIISAGEENPYGHPSPELLERLDTSGTTIFRTDQDGAVQVLTDGYALKVSCFMGCSGRSAERGLVETEPPN